MLQPGDLRKGCQPPFWWWLNGIKVRDFSRKTICDLVYVAVAEGASGVFSHVGCIVVNEKSALSLRVFTNAARHVGIVLKDSISPENHYAYKRPLKAYH